MNTYSIWRINDQHGTQLGLLSTPTWLDILDVTSRAKNRFGETSNWQSPIYLGDVEI